ncbi:hypothetical protein ACN6MY_15110 [Peribacillus sp. B-H-3]|uniref:hypothetical protein n=1 Tax=Peribacillus sp. B-H-3 TaxID=3400420 RepID=UPI003B02C908
MKEPHETQPADDFNNERENEIYTPIEDYQKITAGAPFKRDSMDIGSFPKGIRIIGYFFVFFIVLTMVFSIILTIFKS